MSEQKVDTSRETVEAWICDGLPLPPSIAAALLAERDALQAQLDEVRLERVDWARRFTLDGKTPAEWMRLARTAQERIRELEEKVMKLGAFNPTGAD